jgi:hypothetical protein
MANGDPERDTLCVDDAARISESSESTESNESIQPDLERQPLLPPDFGTKASGYKSTEGVTAEESLGQEPPSKSVFAVISLLLIGTLNKPFFFDGTLTREQASSYLAQMGL